MPQPPLLLFFWGRHYHGRLQPQKITHTPLHDDNDGDDDDSGDDEDMAVRMMMTTTTMMLDIDVDNDEDDSHKLMFLTSTVASGHKQTGCSSVRLDETKTKTDQNRTSYEV